MTTSRNLQSHVTLNANEITDGWTGSEQPAIGVALFVGERTELTLGPGAMDYPARRSARLLRRKSQPYDDGSSYSTTRGFKRGKKKPDLHGADERRRAMTTSQHRWAQTFSCRVLDAIGLPDKRRPPRGDMKHRIAFACTSHECLDSSVLFEAGLWARVS